MRFDLCITMGNDAMQTGMDIAESLRGVAALIEDETLDTLGMPAGPIKDINGNVVGGWEVRRV